MIGSEDTDEQLEDSGAAYPDGAGDEIPDTPGPQHYDPLFEAWPDTPSQQDAAAFDADDVLWLTSGDWRPSAFESAGPLTAPSRLQSSAAEPWPSRAAPALSTLQQQVRSDAVTAPRPSPRAQGVQVAFIGVALLLLGVMAAANGLDTAASELRYGAYGALISGALLTSAGVAAATFGLPLPLPGVVTLREVAETVLLAVLIFLAVRATFQNFKVEGASMQPSLHNNQYLIVNKLSYAGLDLSFFNFLPFVDEDDHSILHLWGSPSRGDVIVFHAPESPGRDFIKRIIGTPGDTVEINGATGKVTVNGQFLEEPYIQGTTNCNNVSCTWTLPRKDSEEARTQCGSNACYFVMGDNRQNSSDSRGGWLVPEENIIGKTVITYWDEGKVDVEFAPNHSVRTTSEAAAQE